MQRIVKAALALILVLCMTASAQTDIGEAKQVAAVKKTVVDAYIDGIFLKGDAGAVKKGWHAECDIVIFQNGTLKKLPATYWVKRLTEHPGPLNPRVTYKFAHVHVNGYAAIATVEVFDGEKPLYMDFMNLYKFEDGWKICTKTFLGYPR